MKEGREKGNRVRVWWGKRRKVGGFRPKGLLLPFSPPHDSDRGRGGAAGAAGRRQIPANRATAADERWGKTKRASRGFYSRAYLALGQPEGAAPREGGGSVVVLKGRRRCGAWGRLVRVKVHLGP
jgi:hypothetical protein